ncbi:MAG: rRNA maturation RNase YbeY [Ignavibacteriales bacterium]|nr:rRNA maturation RNase YbeY [Ignavibacteriales bacterium]
MKSIKIFSEKGIRVDKKKIDLLVQKLMKELQFSIDSLEFNFVGTKTITEINNKYLNHSGSTDIITFNYSDERFRFDGEIFISVPDAYENAKKYKVTIDNEIERLIIHGVLHLLGYDDLTPAKKRTMKKYENKFVKQFEKISKGLLLS